VGQLRPVWTLSTGGKLGGLEATPLYHDGVLYFSADYSRVFAVDVRTGTVLWKYEPKFEDGLDAMLCCGPVNRGVALLGDKVYVATLDARLVALNAKDGSVAWEQKIDDWKHGLSETGAPFVMKGHIIIGISGGEYGVRGYLKAYDPEAGTMQWTTYTVPAPGESGSET
jgi:alcohol dehydrogenase (cytochrome c)